MATTLVVNPGSTSRKYALYKEGVLVRVLFFEETGKSFVVSDIKNGTKCSEVHIRATEFAASVSYTLAHLINTGEIASRHEIAYVGVRVVAPGTFFTTHRLIDDAYVQALQEVAPIAPLHIPGLIEEIHGVRQELAHAVIVGVSDTSFHRTIPEHVAAISIDRADAQAYDIKRFGYHGLSFASLTRRLEEVFDEVPARVIMCHIGGGISVAAIHNGKSVATSMGYTPASGMIMGSRGGDVTAGVLATLIQKKKLQGEELYEYLYKQSGFQGVAGVRDLRLVLDRAVGKNHEAMLAVDMFVHQIHSWIAAHVVQMGGVDAIVLTATAAERNPVVRSLVLEGLEVFNIKIDAEKNDACIGCEGEIGASDSAVRIAVLKTDEMGEIARVAESL